MALLDPRYECTALGKTVRRCFGLIGNVNGAVSSTTFIEFMLSSIKAPLMESMSVSDEISDATKGKSEERWKQIEQFLERNDIIQNADVRRLCGISAATAYRILAKFTAEGKLAKCRKGGHWGYRRTNQEGSYEKSIY